ncbi:MAG: hypothetical protein CME06_05185 [Gemmatimonadetes bacterium]|nr:hypothetical protein [Gemmatimonadota bacterium]
MTGRLDDLYRSSSSHASIRMEVRTSDFSRTIEIESWSVGDDLALMVIRAPAREAGTATLRTEEGLWNYAPRADRLMRIPPALLSDSWMGSHFSNDDLMRESELDDDYGTVLDWHQEGDARFLRATMTPHADAAVVYTSVVQLLEPDTWLPIRVDYYDDNEIVRRMHFSNVKALGDRSLPSVLELVPSDKPTELTRVVYEEMEFDIEIDGNLFTPRGLRRASRKR